MEIQATDENSLDCFNHLDGSCHHCWNHHDIDQLMKGLNMITMNCKIKGPNCLNEYQLGHNGTQTGCDNCTDVQRDKQGRKWYPEQNVKTFRPVGAPDDGSQDYAVTREQAFS